MQGQAAVQTVDTKSIQSKVNKSKWYSAIFEFKVWAILMIFVNQELYSGIQQLIFFLYVPLIIVIVHRTICGERGRELQIVTKRAKIVVIVTHIYYICTALVFHQCKIHKKTNSSTICKYQDALCLQSFGCLHFQALYLVSITFLFILSTECVIQGVS